MPPPQIVTANQNETVSPESVWSITASALRESERFAGVAWSLIRNMASFHLLLKNVGKEETQIHYGREHCQPGLIEGQFRKFRAEILEGKLASEKEVGETAIAA